VGKKKPLARLSPSLLHGIPGRRWYSGGEWVGPWGGLIFVFEPLGGEYLIFLSPWGVGEPLGGA
jgi:hypothetical protein